MALAVSTATAAFSTLAVPRPLPHVAPGFTIGIVARIARPRELAVAPNGDLFVGTSGSDVYVVPDAQGSAGAPRVFATFDDTDAAGVALAGGDLFVGSRHGVWRIPYRTGSLHADGAPKRIAALRQRSDGGHDTTSVAVAGATVYASVGSSCNACNEIDPERGSIQEMTRDGGEVRARAVRIRNAVALAVDPATNALWAGVAGQDELDHGHPYEIFDDVSAHAGTADYMWPGCYENARPVHAGDDCLHAPIARVVFPAYETPIGAAFYPEQPTGAHAFPAAYRGGAFVTLHGSWHQPPVEPRVAFVPMHRDVPLKPVDWSDPAAQWTPFVDGFQVPDGPRIGRPTGIAVAPDGSLFVADDTANAIYRIRPQ